MLLKRKLGNSMMIQRIILVGVLCGLVVSITLASTGWAQTETKDVEATWTKPNIGTEPVIYHVWVRSKENGAVTFGDWEEWASTSDLKQTLTFKTDRCYEVKVNAEDKDGLVGPDSIPSLEYCDLDFTGGGGVDLAPGEPGKPTLNE